MAYRLETSWTATHKFALVTKNHNTVFGFWFASVAGRREFLINLGRSICLRRAA